jgi:hypothetical protein
VVIWIGGIVAHPPFEKWRRRGKVTLGRFDVAAGEGGPALIKCLRALQQFFSTVIRQNPFRGGIIPLQHGEVPTRRNWLMIWINRGRNALQNIAAGSEVIVLNNFPLQSGDRQPWSS